MRLVLDENGRRYTNLTFDPKTGEVVYPHPHCFQRVPGGCRACPRFFCTRCRKMRPWCAGAADEHGSWCDDCSQEHLKPTPCRVCEEKREPKKRRRKRARARRRVRAARR